MSAMSKYFKQTCSLQRIKTTNGVPDMNDYGELEYESARIIKCRRERYIRDVEVQNGGIIKSQFEYYTDYEVGINDKIDGEVVLTIEDYVNGSGRVIGYRSIT